ncbi:hypothetical protein NVIE_025010 [Nitrososphaera viennensis EN76]|uniref:Uncharacterized protein n=1 Tax=Nitrososphaera viennensis EN76 TaxID=926571 RepID=A0A060HMP6_9ARCH|nr:hypothetical protein NVIE_025010 [Nitrososphaera viennensis EN76]
MAWWRGLPLLAMSCRNICVRHRATRPTDGIRYAAGQKRCRICDIFITWMGPNRPCCNYRLRTRSRLMKYKIKTVRVAYVDMRSSN